VVKLHRRSLSRCFVGDLGRQVAKSTANQYVEHYNTRWMHSTIGYVTPANKLATCAGNLRRTGPQTEGRLLAAPDQAPGRQGRPRSGGGKTAKTGLDKANRGCGRNGLT
jgi:hypothetical protein